MNERDVISDAAWALIEPLLPSMAPQRGGRWREHRQVLEGIAWRFRTGAPWRDMPERFGPWQTIYERFNLWAKDGTFARMHRQLMARAHAAGELDWIVSIDSTIVRAHQHAAGARPVRLPAHLEVVRRDARHTGGSIELQRSAVPAC